MVLGQIDNTSSMEEAEDYISRITRLANRNKELSSQLDHLVKRYSSFQKRTDTYLDLVSEFTPELGSDKALKASQDKAFRVKMCSIVYVAIEGFAKVIERPDAQQLIDELDDIHRTLDDIALKHKMFMVKTIGDSYLYVAGIEDHSRTNPIDSILAANEMQFYINNVVREGGKNNQPWNLRIGVHTGTAMAEHTGKKNSPYKVTGEAVNIASRLGMVCDPGKVNVSVMTYELVKEFFVSDQWHSMPVKYKGLIDMFYVDGIIPELLGSNPIEPSDLFFTKYRLIQFMDIQEELLDYLEQNLPLNLYYHNVKHTIDVVTEVELIGLAEGLSEEEVMLLKLAALFHDAGHTINYKDHEMHGVHIVHRVLKKYNFKAEQIATIDRLIMATKFPPTPTDKLEMVICDSDLDYLGRSDFIPVSHTLYKELKDRDMIGSFVEWNELQLKFIRSHQYFTSTALNLREVNKQSQIDRLEGLINAGVEDYDE